MSLTENPKHQSEKSVDIIEPEKLIKGVMDVFIGDRIDEQKGIQTYNVWKDLKEEGFNDSVRLKILDLLKHQDYYKNLKTEEEKRSLEDCITLPNFLKHLILSVGAQTEASRIAVFQNLNQTYVGVLSDQQDLFKKEVQKLQSGELQRLVASTAALENFVTRKFPDFEKRSQQKKLELFAYDTSIRLEEIQNSDVLKEAVTNALNKKDLTYEQLKLLLEKTTTLSWKRNLVQVFRPQMGLHELMQLGIIDSEKADAIVDAFLQETYGWFQTNFSGLSDEEKDDFRLAIRKNISLPTSSLKDADVSIIFNNANLPQLTAFVNAEQTKSRQEMTVEKAQNQDDLMVVIRNNLRDSVDPSKCKLENIDDLVEGGVIRLIHRNRSDNEQTYYIKINKIGNKPSIIEVENITAVGGYKKTGVKEEMVFSQFYELLTHATEAKVLLTKENHALLIGNQEDYKALEETEKVREIADTGVISSYELLRNKLDVIDPKWAQYKEDDFFIEFEDNTNGVGVFSVQHDQATKEMKVTNAQGQIEKLSYSAFYSAFDDKKCKRIAKIADINSLLGSLGGIDKIGDGYKKLIVDKAGDENQFMLQNQKDIVEDPSKGIKRQVVEDFLDNKGAGFRVKKAGDHSLRVCFIEVKRNEKDKKETISVSDDFDITPYAFYQEVKEKKLEPREPKPKDQKIYDPIKQDRTLFGTINSFFAHQSVHTMLVGLKNLPDLFIEQAKSDSHILASEFALGFANTLHFPEEFKIELRGKVEKADNAKIEEKVEFLSGLGSYTRQKLIAWYLKNKAFEPKNGKPHYMILAAARAMIKSHGSLYVGALQEYRGTMAFFTKMGGTPAIRDAIYKYDLEDGVARTEEQLIYKYAINFTREDSANAEANKLKIPLQKRFSDKYWSGFRGQWSDGTNKERKAGEDYVESFASADSVFAYMKQKLDWWEFSHGLGCLKKYYAKCSDSKDGNRVPFLIAMSNMTSVMHQTNRAQLKDMFWSGYPYPGLAFLDSQTNIETYQQTIDQLVEKSDHYGMEKSKSDAMKKDYEEIKKGRSQPNKKLTQAVDTFWVKYGDYLNTKLLATNDSDMVIEQGKDGEFKKYYDHLQERLGSTSFQKPNEDAVSNRLTDLKSSSFVEFYPDTLFRFLKTNHTGNLDRDGDVQHIFKYTLLEKLRSIRKIRDPKLQKENYKKWHKHLTKWFCEIDVEKAEGHLYAREVQELFGYTFPKTNLFNIDEITPEYERRMEEDYARYTRLPENGSIDIKRKISEEVRVVTEWKVSDILTFMKESQSGRPVARSKPKKAA